MISNDSCLKDQKFSLSAYRGGEFPLKYTRICGKDKDKGKDKNVHKKLSTFHLAIMQKLLQLD